MGRRAVFLDRDGVINESIIREGKPYPPASVQETVIVPDAEEALNRLKQCGFLLVVVSNQPDVGRGKSSQEGVEEIHKLLSRKLPLDDFFTCYHDDQDGCNCRKPMPGLLLEAAKKYDIEMTGSYLVGDRWRDIDAGRAAGCRTIFIDYRYDERKPQTPPDVSVGSLSEAVDWILEHSARAL